MHPILRQTVVATLTIMIAGVIAGCSDDPVADHQNVDLMTLPPTVVGPASYQPAARGVALGRMGAAMIQTDVQHVVSAEPPLPIMSPRAPSLASVMPVAAVQAENLPAPAPTTATFQVYFDFAISAVSPAAEATIKQAVAALSVSRLTTIAVTGHTDTVGADNFNMGLSMRRAAAVKAALVKLGIPANEISIAGVGKSDPQVPTAEGVREPQNRRVVILLR